MKWSELSPYNEKLLYWQISRCEWQLIAVLASLLSLSCCVDDLVAVNGKPGHILASPWRFTLVDRDQLHSSWFGATPPYTLCV
jgi:hypothetical protein